MMFSIPLKVSEFIISKDKMFFCSDIYTIDNNENVDAGTELPLFFEGKGVSSNFRKAIFSYAFRDEKITKITGDDISVTGMVINEVETKVGFTGASMDRYIKNESNIYLMDTESEKFEMLVLKDSLNILNIAFIDNETVIFAGAGLTAYGRNENPELYTYDISKKRLKRITNNFDRSISEKR